MSEYKAGDRVRLTATDERGVVEEVRREEFGPAHHPHWEQVVRVRFEYSGTQTMRAAHFELADTHANA